MIRIKKNNPFFIFLVVFGLLFFLHSVGALRLPENFLLSSVKPLSARLYGWGSSLDHSYQVDQTAVGWPSRAAELTKEVSRLTVANSRCVETASENQKLRNLLHFLSVNNFQAVTTEVIAKEAASEDSRDLIINQGSQDGLRVGYGVISEEGVIIGKIVETKEMTAKICLTTSPTCQLAATLQNEGKTQGITAGDLGLTIKMNYIPKLEKVAEGDLVITSGLGGNIPRGLVIGRVTKIKNESNEVWQEATIEPIANPDNLTIVSVIIP
jgi:rod shape-determining protein MreC